MQQALLLRKLLSPTIKTVGVFVNQPIEEVVSFAKSGAINVVQLHGKENREYIAELKAKVPMPVIKATGIADGKVEPYPDNCDYVLLDAAKIKGAGSNGGKVEWRRYPEIDKPFFLAGGITPENVGEAVTAVRPYGVDTSGGVETDGQKDNKKIEEYILNIRKINEVNR
ncbi:MAG: phosphoribosylanthranilate isomerase [Clostridia bacterium]|nr:phosphoribosylanthranilate isomerase [Clostridia bacterium]